MRKIIFSILTMAFLFAANSYAQDTKAKDASKAKNEQKAVVKKDVATPAADKPVNGKKGPNGEAIYQGAKGGQYYINKSGNKIYLEVDKIVAGKKGPAGEIVYEGINGGQYFINKNGNKTYLTKDKK